MTFTLYKHAWLWTGPEYDEPRLSRADCRALLKKGGWLVRNTYDFDCGEETGFWYVVKDSFGGLEELSSKMRNQLRRSMANYTFRPMTRDELLAMGYEVHRAAAEGYKVKASVPTKEDFRNEIIHGPENEYWGSFDKADGHLAAFAKNIAYEQMCDYSVMKARPDDLSHYPYYGLIHTMNEHYLKERGMKYVNDGGRSITEHSNIQPFLMQKFHFRKAYCRINIVYQPWLAVMVKALYPFRKWIPVASVRSLLRQEEMTRL